VEDTFKQESAFTIAFEDVAADIVSFFQSRIASIRADHLRIGPIEEEI
jgi:hypothetical protein